jgi:hypothetical protein
MEILPRAELWQLYRASIGVFGGDNSQHGVKVKVLEPVSCLRRMVARISQQQINLLDYNNKHSLRNKDKGRRWLYSPYIFAGEVSSHAGCHVTMTLQSIYI